MSAMSTSEAEARDEHQYHQPDDPMDAKMVADSISDERALAIRRLADMSCQVLDTRDLRLAFGRGAA